MDIVESSHVLGEDLQVFEIIGAAADPFHPRGDVVEIKALRVAFPLIGRVLFGVERDERLEVGELLGDGQLGRGGPDKKRDERGGASARHQALIQ